MLASVPRPHTAVNGTSTLRGAPSAYSRAPIFVRVPAPQIYTLTIDDADLCSDVLGTVGVGEGVTRLLKVEARWTDVRNHHGLAVAAERIFEQPRQLAVAIIYILTARLVTYTQHVRI